MRFAFAILLAATFCAPAATHAQLRGQGGPVRALAASPDGASAVSGGFDARAIVWSLRDGRAARGMRRHEDAVTAVAMLPAAGVVTGGASGLAASW